MAKETFFQFFSRNVCKWPNWIRQRVKKKSKATYVHCIAAISLLTRCLCLNDVSLDPEVATNAQSKDSTEGFHYACSVDHENAVVEILSPRHGSWIEVDQVTLNDIRPGLSVIDVSLLDSDDREVGIMSSTSFVSQVSYTSRSEWKILSDWSRTSRLYDAIYVNPRPYRMLVSYGTEAFQDSLKKLAATAISVGGIDGVKMILNQRKGAGLWLWKPYFINQSLHSLSEGDLLMYADAQLMFVSSATPLFEIAKEEESGVVSFGMAQHKEYMYTKKEVLLALNCSDKCRSSGQRCLSESQYLQNLIPRTAQPLLLCSVLISDEEYGDQQHEDVISPIRESITDNTSTVPVA
eukprot:748210-Hanusia_phi.AAC.4